ncbi:putative yeats family protein [Eutypa lata UCREL1]|uniref:Protein AF-9 homolog n=1 Tax=Eutypa lata (strain UCR-EL1) TaxID=1287681 RepID=M7TI70_EUTLA|nr:putative yeats family protein [Eutypa lata UCREL1]
MAPPGGKRMKGVQIFRPFIYGTTARPFNDTDNPKPPGVPADHTHSWQVFVKGIEDTDIFYWLRRVQFKLHESIPNHLRTLDADAIIRESNAAAAAANNNSSNSKKPATAAQQQQQHPRAFVVNETGWGEFEITIKLYYDSRSGEKPQTLYHHLRLHPYGRTEAEKEAMRSGGEVVAWTYEEQLFNEPFEDFYHVLTTGAHDKGTKPPPTPTTGGGKGKGGGKGGSSSKPTPQQQQASADGSGGGGDVKERSAMIPQSNKPGQPFSRDTEALEIKRLREAGDKVHDMVRQMNKAIKDKEAELAQLKAENAVPANPTAAAKNNSANAGAGAGASSSGSGSGKAAATAPTPAPKTTTTAV